MTEPNYAISTGGDSRPISTNVLSNTGNGNVAADENLHMGARASMVDPGYGSRPGRRGPDLFVVVTFILGSVRFVFTNEAKRCS